PVRFVVRWHFWKIASPAQQRRLKEKSRRTLSNGRSCRIYLSSFLISHRASTAQSRYICRADFGNKSCRSKAERDNPPTSMHNYHSHTRTIRNHKKKMSVDAKALHYLHI